MGRGRPPLPQPTYPDQVWAALPTLAGLANVSMHRLQGWIAAGQLVPLATVEPRHPRTIIKLYRLSEVLALKESRKE